MNEDIKQIIELTSQLQKLGCQVEIDNTGQIVIYTGVVVENEIQLN